MDVERGRGSRELPVDIEREGEGPGSCQWTLRWGGDPLRELPVDVERRGGRGSGELPVDVERGRGPGICQWTLRGGGGTRELPVHRDVGGQRIHDSILFTFVNDFRCCSHSCDDRIAQKAAEPTVLGKTQKQ